MKHLFFLFIVIASFSPASGQTAAPSFNFIEYQRSFPRISEALRRKEDALKMQFREQKLEWPARNIYIRSFKYDSELEVWVKPQGENKYKLFKTYKVCALAGTLGPKRMRGDYQVPEGFYYINEFNPRSACYLSLGLNYPNSSDRMLGDSLQPGGDIYIHGGAKSIGCLALGDPAIEELFCLIARSDPGGRSILIAPVDLRARSAPPADAPWVRDLYGRLAAKLAAFERR